jgi:hypothetical protein
MKTKASRISNRNYANKKKKFVREYKCQVGCMDCGYNDIADVLEFDHRPDEVKLFEVGKADLYGWEMILAEIKKCDVVCANCHRIRTVKRRDQFKFTFDVDKQPKLWETHEP